MKEDDLMSGYILPKIKLGSFNCPHCGTYSQQIWAYYFFAGPYLRSITEDQMDYTEGDQINNFVSVSNCVECHKFLIWHNNDMIYPSNSTAPMPSDDMPKEIIDDYFEARDVFPKSPRASAALLRLVIQKLLIVLGEKGKNINDDIAGLVSKGLPISIQKALDIVRVIGNNAVHPGTIDVNDNPQATLALFNLVNIIVNTMITQPKEIDKLYSSLPEEVLSAIKDMDSQ